MRSDIIMHDPSETPGLLVGLHGDTHQVKFTSTQVVLFHHIAPTVLSAFGSYVRIWSKARNSHEFLSVALTLLSWYLDVTEQ